MIYLGVMKRLIARIRRLRVDNRENRNWRLLHDNAPAHQSTLITDFFTKNVIFTIYHPPCSSYLALCDINLFRKLHLTIKGEPWSKGDYFE